VNNILCRPVLLTVGTLIVGSPVPAAAAAPFDGRWVSDLSACASDGPLIVTSQALRWREAACAISRSYRVGDTWHIGARCSAEGATSDIAIKLEMRGERLVLGWPGAPAEELRRCP
jgi:hypothetical protein